MKTCQEEQIEVIYSDLAVKESTTPLVFDGDSKAGRVGKLYSEKRGRLQVRPD